MINSIIGVVVGIVIGFLVTKWYLKKEMDKSPAISEKTIRAMMIQMGKKPNEQQVKRILQKVNACK